MACCVKLLPMFSADGRPPAKQTTLTTGDESCGGPKMMLRNDDVSASDIQACRDLESVGWKRIMPEDGWWGGTGEHVPPIPTNLGRRSDGGELAGSNLESERVLNTKRRRAVRRTEVWKVTQTGNNVIIYIIILVFAQRTRSVVGVRLGILSPMFSPSCGG